MLKVRLGGDEDTVLGAGERGLEPRLSELDRLRGEGVVGSEDIRGGVFGGFL